MYTHPTEIADAHFYSTTSAICPGAPAAQQFCLAIDHHTAGNRAFDRLFRIQLKQENAMVFRTFYAAQANPFRILPAVNHLVPGKSLKYRSAEKRDSFTCRRRLSIVFASDVL